MNALPFPRPQSCHHCGHEFVGAICPTCKSERPAYTALKNISARAPITCRYYPKVPCNCGGRGTCLDAA